MTPLDHEVVNCVGFEIVSSLPWDLQGAETVAGSLNEHQALKLNHWGFLICRPPDAAKYHATSDMDRLYGVVGQIQSDHIHESCLAIPLGVLDPKSALSHFALACGLSIIDRAELELGDTVVVAGANPLALSVLLAASVQGARSACLVSNSNEESGYLQDIGQLAEVIGESGAGLSFDSKLDAFVALSRGKTVFVDAAGVPNLVQAMTSRLEASGTLVLCRQDVLTSLQIDLYTDIHRKSAQVAYWARPQDLKDALSLFACCARAANLFQWRRVALAFTEGTGARLDPFHIS